MLEYFVIGEKTHAFIVTRDGFVHRELPVGTALATAVAQRFAFHVAKSELGSEVVGQRSALHLDATRANLARANAFVAPLRDALVTRRLVIVPHGALHAIPFHALPDDVGWLADAFEICYAPSASVFASCGERRHDDARATGRASVLALEDEAAPMIGAEARGVAAALRGAVRTYTGAAATSERLREAALTSRVLHVATHGMFRADEPALSSIRLADTWLNVHDVHALDVRASLVVLSACETGAAAITAGEEPLGLVRAFLGAGAPCVLASRWRVEDTATAAFMEAFHGCRSTGGANGEPADDPMSALRRAMAAVRKTRPHPYHWAAFVLVGHPGWCTAARRGGSASADLPRGQHSEGGRSPWVPRF